MDNGSFAVSFRYFAELYLNSKTNSLSREIIYYTDGALKLELYKYELTIFLDKEDEDQYIKSAYTHPVLDESNVDEYVNFLHLMMIVISSHEKKEINIQDKYFSAGEDEKHGDP
jgi:hypothetical protein